MAAQLAERVDQVLGKATRRISIRPVGCRIAALQGPAACRSAAVPVEPPYLGVRHPLLRSCRSDDRWKGEEVENVVEIVETITMSVEIRASQTAEGSCAANSEVASGTWLLFLRLGRFDFSES